MTRYALNEHLVHTGRQKNSPLDLTVTHRALNIEELCHQIRAAMNALTAH